MSTITLPDTVSSIDRYAFGMCGLANDNKMSIYTTSRSVADLITEDTIANDEMLGETYTAYVYIDGSLYKTVTFTCCFA